MSEMMMDAQDVLFLLCDACNKAGSQKQWAAINDLSTAYVCDVLQQRRAPGVSILAALGLERVVGYRRRAAIAEKETGK